LGLGFLISLPIWLFSTPEEKQRLTQTTATMRIVEHHVGLLDITEEYREDIKHLLKKEVTPSHVPPALNTWQQQISPEIMKFGSNQHEANAIAHWVWIYSQQHNLNPALVLGLVSIESRFDPYALSSVGAQGLMQIMPFWKHELGSKHDNLYDIATNIRYGCAILRHYINRYGSERRALAAYNGSLGKDKYPNKVFSQVQRFNLEHIL